MCEFPHMNPTLFVPCRKNLEIIVIRIIALVLQLCANMFSDAASFDGLMKLSFRNTQYFSDFVVASFKFSINNYKFFKA